MNSPAQDKELTTDIVVVCPYCRCLAKLVNSQTVYGASHGLLWRCEPCGAHVGVHKNSARYAPLGQLANAELRAARQKAHIEFDALWKRHNMTRQAAYQWMARNMGKNILDAHIGKFSVSECHLLIKLVHMHLGTRNY